MGRRRTPSLRFLSLHPTSHHSFLHLSPLHSSRHLTSPTSRQVALLRPTSPSSTTHHITALHYRLTSPHSASPCRLASLRPAPPRFTPLRLASLRFTPHHFASHCPHRTPLKRNSLEFRRSVNRQSVGRRSVGRRSDRRAGDQDHIGRASASARPSPWSAPKGCFCSGIPKVSPPPNLIDILGFR